MFLSPVGELLFSTDGGHLSHKEAEFRLLLHPSPPITQATETDEILSLLYWFLCIAAFFLCPSRPPNPIGGVLVLQRSREDSLYPVMPLTLNKSSRVRRKGSTWKRAVGTLLPNVLVASCFVSYWNYIFVLTRRSVFPKQIYYWVNSYVSNWRSNLWPLLTLFLPAPTLQDISSL